MTSMASAAASTQLNAKQQAYKKLTDARSAQTAEGFMKLLGQHTLEVDLSTTPPFQMECLLRVLHSVPSFQTVRIRNSERAQKPYLKRPDAQKSNNHRRSSSSANPESDAQKPLIPSLNRNHHLITLELDSIPASLVKRIPNMMKGSIASLKHLLIRNVAIDEPSLTKLMQTIATSQVSHLELVNCSLNGSCGKELKEVISIHNIRRDVAKWQDKLRDQDNGSNSSSMGLLHINLSNNQLQDNAIRPIIEALVDDKWVKSLNLSSNSLSNSIIGEFIDLLKVNSSLNAVAVDDNHELDRGMVALLQTTLSLRLNDKHEFEAAFGTSDADNYPVVVKDQKLPPKKVQIPSAKATKTVSSSELIRSLEKLFHNQADSTDAFAREQFREVVSGVQKLTDMLGKTQDQLKQTQSENEDLKAEIKKLGQRGSISSNRSRHSRISKKRTKKRISDHEREIGSAITEQDLDDMVEVIEMFESVFVRLHKYMDSLEISKDDTSQGTICSNQDQVFTDLSEKVRKSAAILSKLQPKIQQ